MKADITKEARKIAKDLWDCFNQGAWLDARKLLADDFEAHWPQTREKMGPDQFIELNRIYPGQHQIAVQNINVMPSLDKNTVSVITETKIESKIPDGNLVELFAVSFFKVSGESKILLATAYWADCSESPEWRRHLVVRY